MAAGKKRQLNYELLRVIAMLMIVCLHYLSKGGLLGDPARADMNATGYAVWLVEAFCLVAVNVYVLISGYFGVDAQEPLFGGAKITLRGVLGRPFKIWKQVFFYSMLFGCGALIIGVQEFDLYQFFAYCFPLVTEHYWFATYYVVLCLMMPFLNAGITYLEQKEIQYLLAGLLLFFCISKTVLPMQLPWDKYGYDALWFIVMYLTGAYLKRYKSAMIKTRGRAVALYLGSTMAIFASFFLIRMIYLKTGKLEAMIHYGYTYNFLFCYTGAVGLFLAFQAYKAREGKLERFRKPIELLAGASFGVYLIHEHINIRYVWPKWLHCGEQIGSSVAGFLCHMLVSVVCVYLVCTVIELIRQKGSLTILPALILLLYPLRHACVGLDLMDAGYALGNYRFFGVLNQTWKLATYLANITGVIISKLPFGNYWVGMNVYCGLLIGATAAGVYLFLWKRYGQNRRIYSVLLFVSELTALSLCWAPNVILYHYMGYLLMTIAVMVLFTAVTKEQERQKRKYFVIAGMILGLCVAVRMPNITYMALILPVWCDCFWNRRRSTKPVKASDDTENEDHAGNADNLYKPVNTASKVSNVSDDAACVDKPANLNHLDMKSQKHLQKKTGNSAWFRLLMTRTLYCIGGYLAGLLVPLLVICVRYGAAAYPQMISSLFGMTDHAADYKPTSMVTAMFADYVQYSAWLFLFAGYMMVGLFFFYLLDKVKKLAAKKKITYAFEVLYALGLFVVLRFCYGRGLFDFDYSDYFSMYKWVTVYLLIVIMLCIGVLFYKAAGRDTKLWAVFLLVMIFVTPLGSNNGLYPIINNLFLVIPVSVLMIGELFGRSYIFESKKYAFRITLGFILVCTAVQCVLFGIEFVFHDKGVQNNDTRVRIKLQCSDAAAGLVTTAAKAQVLEELDGFLYQSHLNEKQVILYGDIPALSYLLDMEPAIFTTWADLDSNSMEALEEDLNHLAGEEAPDACPVIILGRSSIEGLTETKVLPGQKLQRIMDFAEENGYWECFRNSEYVVLLADF